MIIVLSMTGDDEQGLDEIVERLAGDFVLHRRFTNDNFLVRFQCVEDHLADILAVVGTKEIHERLDAGLNHVVILEKEFFLA